MGITLKVTAEELVCAADSATENIEKVRSCVDEIERMIERLSACWEGEGSRIHWVKFKAARAEAGAVLNEAADLPVKLLKMAGLYKRVEQENASESGMLSSNVIW